MSVKTEYEFYNEGFFGYGEKGDFDYFSLEHFLPIAFMLFAIFMIYRFREFFREWRGEENFRFVLAFIILIVEMSYYWRLMYVGSAKPEEGTLMTKLPFQVCQWSAILASFMLMKKSRNLYSVCYFICLTLGVVPLLTPAVISTTGPEHYRYYQFWLEHMLPIIAVFYMTFVHGFRVRPKDMIKPLSLLLILAVFSIFANNAIPEANYLYLAADTDGDSIANLLPQNMTVRLTVYVIAVLSLFALVYQPMRVTRKKEEKKILSHA